MVYKVHIKGGSDNTAPFTPNHPHIQLSSYKLQLAEVPSAASYVGMVMCEWHFVITATLYVYFVY